MILNPMIFAYTSDVGRNSIDRRTRVSESQNSDLAARLLRTPDAAELLGLSRRTLEKHRTYGTGPKYLKLGGRVVYRVSDLREWASLGERTSTSDPGNGIVRPAKRRAEAE